jgi:hypothetical protein
MPLFHRHDWQVIAKTYAPPQAWGGPIEGPSIVIQQLACGVTTVLLKCACGAGRREEMLGAVLA